MEKLAYIIGIFIIAIILFISCVYFTHNYTLKNMKINVVNEQDDIIQVETFNQTWIFEY